MKLSQYENFFSKHFDLEVKTRGMFLIRLIDHLQSELLTLDGWPQLPFVHCRHQMKEIELRTIIHAIDKHGGSKIAASRWLGISRQSLYNILKKWNKSKTTPKATNENKTISYDSSHCATFLNSLPVDKATNTRKRIV